MEIPDTLRNRAISELFSKKKMPFLGVSIDDTEAMRLAEETYEAAMQIASETWKERKQAIDRHVTEMNTISSRAGKRAEKDSQESRANFLREGPDALMVFGLSELTARTMLEAIMADCPHP